MSAVLAIDLGGTKVAVAVVGSDGAVLARGRKKVQLEGDWEHLQTRIVRAAQKALEGTDLTLDDLAGCGIGVPGPVDFERGVAYLLPNLDLADVPVAQDLTKALGRPVYVENDVNAGLMGEIWMGVARGKNNVVGMFPGTGLGGGIYANGVLLRGKTGITGEIGHIVMDPKGPVCGCGQKGCLEAYASRTAMQNYVEQQVAKGKKTVLAAALAETGGRIGSREFLAAIEQGDAVAKATVKRTAEYLGYACASLIHLLSPEMIVLGGGVMEALAPYMLDRIREVAEARCMPGCYDGIEIVDAQCGDDAGILGVAAVTFESLGHSVL